MENYKQSYILLIKRIIYLVLVYSLLRFLFLVFNWNSFQNISTVSFFGGIRFDLSVIFYSNILLIIGHTIPGNFKYTKKYQQILKWFFYTINVIFLSTNFIDFEYFKFTGKRSTYDLITASGMEQEIGRLIPDFLKMYWYIALLFIVFLVVFYKCIPTTNQNLILPKKLTKKNIFKHTTIFLISLASIILIGRGGLQRKPLSRIDAIIYATSSNTPIVLNTPFCILKTINKKQDLQPFNFFKKEELAKIYSPLKHFKDSTAFNKKNIVLIILESFGDENVSYSNPKEGNTPFLDSLIKKSLYFKNGFANGRVSADAVPSVLSGIPSVFGEPYVTSTYAFNKVSSIPEILKKEGYYTAFFHGAFNGSQNFEQYSEIAGFNDFFGKNEYPQTYPDEEDGKWGIFDEEFFGFFAEKITSFEKPFFASIFTISSHIPFTVPNKYKGKLKKGPTQFFEMIGYTDMALKKFFDYAKQKDWYQNTLFVITADHTSMGKKGGFKSILHEYSIPILFFDPTNATIIETPNRNFQQIDILPSILKYLKYPKPFISYGFDYSIKKDNIVINYINDMYHITINDYYIIFDGNKTIELYNFKEDTKLENNIISQNKQLLQKLERQFKAYLQSINNNIINNNLTIE